VQPAERNTKQNPLLNRVAKDAAAKKPDKKIPKILENGPGPETSGLQNPDTPDLAKVRHPNATINKKYFKNALVINHPIPRGHN